MAHHGQNPFEGAEPEVFKKMKENLKRLDVANALGDTGRYPQGALTKDDEGELKFAVVRHGNKIVLSFGKPVEWIGFDSDQAIELAQLLIKRAGEAKGVPMTLRIGRE